jgi:ankyrin repeat protein
MVEQYITWLNERGFHPDELEYPGFNGNTPLLLAALEGNAMIVSRLIEAGADINDTNLELVINHEVFKVLRGA